LGLFVGEEMLLEVSRWMVSLIFGSYDRVAYSSNRIIWTIDNNEVCSIADGHVVLLDEFSKLNSNCGRAVV
jgi:hypothetical protein